MSRVSAQLPQSRVSTEPAQSFETRFNHAAQLKRSKKFKDASLLFAELISIKEKSSSPEDITVLKLRGHYGTCRFYCEDYREAEAHQRETWERWKKVQAPESERHKANAGHELAKTLLKQNEEHLAPAKCEESVDLLTAKLQYLADCDGTHGRQTLVVLRNLSFPLYNLGRFNEKEIFDRQALEQAISLYSNEPDHCDIIDALENLAEDAAFRGGTKEAKGLYEQVLELIKTRQRKGLKIPMTIEYCEQCIAKLCAQGRWRKISAVVRFVVKCGAASKPRRRLHSQRRWRQAIAVTLFIVNSTAVAKYRRCQRAQRRWHEANVVTLLVVRLTVVGKRLIHRKAQEKLEETLTIERESLSKCHQARRRWHEAIVQVLFVVRVAGTGRAIRARRRWQRTFLKVLIVVRMTLRVKACRARKHWRHAFAVVSLRVKVSAATRKLRARGRWYRAFGTILKKNRMVAALNSWHCGVFVKSRAGPGVASSGARAGTESDESNFLPTILPHPEELDFGFDDAESRLFDAEDAERSKPTEKWMADFNKFCRFLQSESSQDDSEPRIKVAILDTGIDAEHAYIKERWPGPGLRDRGYRDFLSSSGDAAPQDNDGHGTHVAGVLMRYAPNAELYIGRIVETNESCRNDEHMKERVAKALKYAIDVWEVDVISMSFGLKARSPDVEAQIINAYRKQVILCAAASNDGIRRGVTFPANDMHVFCINASNGDGIPAPFTPPPRADNVNFSILGMNVLSTWPTFANANPNSKQKKGVLLNDKKLEGTAKHMSGTSMATPVAAALIANVFAYGRVNAARISSRQPLKSWEGVRRLLKGMSKKGHHGYDTVVPWEGKSRRFIGYKTDFAETLRVTLNEEE